jgi:hypothetical protein
MLGFDAGQQALPANQYNPMGYFEDEYVVHANDEVLEQLGRSWLDATSLPLNWIDFDWVAGAQHQLQIVFSTEYHLDGPWVLKDPRICRLLPLWKKVFASLDLSPVYLFVARNPAEVVASLQRRDGLRAHRTLLLYAQHLLEAEWETRGHQRGCVCYDDLVRDWRTTLKSVFELFSLDAPFPNDQKAREIDQFITPSLKHERAAEQRDTDLDGEAWTIAEAVYEVFKKTAPFADLDRFDRLRERLARHLSVVASWQHEAYHAEYLKQHYAGYLQARLTKTDNTLAEDLGLMAKSVLYWQTQTSPGYEEMRRVDQSFHFGQTQSLRFVFAEPIDACTGLRWDITDRAAFCTVQQAWLENRRGERIWSWAPIAPLFGPPSGDMTVVRHPQQTDYGVVLATGGDPHAPLLIPSEVLEQIAQGWAFCATVSFELPTLAIPRLIEIMQAAGEVTAHTAESPLPTHAGFSVTPLSQHAADMATLLKGTLAEHDRALYGKQQQLDRLREELLRAGAQLDMLKDLLLDRMGNDRL